MHKLARLTKKQLAIELSKLKKVEGSRVDLEQYQIGSELGAELVWLASLNGDVKEKVVADLGCGNGILGIGALIAGARKVYFVDVDRKAVDAAEENVRSLGFEARAEFFCCDVGDFKEKADCVIMNPPFGVQKRKADKKFLLKAMEVANKIYSVHKIESRDFIEKLSKENGFEVVKVEEKKFLLKKSYWFHKKEKYFVDVGIWILKKV